MRFAGSLALLSLTFCFNAFAPPAPAPAPVLAPVAPVANFCPASTPFGFYDQTGLTTGQKACSFSGSTYLCKRGCGETLEWNVVKWTQQNISGYLTIEQARTECLKICTSHTMYCPYNSNINGTACYGVCSLEMVPDVLNGCTPSGTPLPFPDYGAKYPETAPVNTTAP